jgi:nickel-dependent lactate racemase
MLYADLGSASSDISDAELEAAVSSVLAIAGKAARVLAVPPDGTRFHSRAGLVTDLVYRILGSRLAAVLPALGTHAPMTSPEIAAMYPGTPERLFRVHDWRRDVVEIGRLDADFVETAGEGAFRSEYPVQVNRLVADEGGFDLVLSIGQVVPHEVAGMANHAKNLFVGTGGKEAIDASHFLGAAYGMERIMGRSDTPVRALWDEALRRFGGRLPPVLWMLTVVGARGDGSLALRGFFAGDDRECFERAAALSREVNLDLLDEALHKAVVYLDPAEYRTSRAR